MAALIAAPLAYFFGLHEYQQRRVTIINLIYSNPVKTLQDFADAFRLKKDHERG